jgi:hypothetical protein
MSNCVTGIHKSLADYVLLQTVGCKQCKQQYVQVDYRQRYCTDCKRLRLLAQQKAYRQKRKEVSK